MMIQLFDKDDQPPYRVHGTFVEEDETYIKVQGTVGDDIGRTILVPKANVKLIALQ